MSTANPDRQFVELESPWGFDETLTRMTKAIKGAGLLVITTLDHAAGAQAAGLDLPPATVVVYGHPKGGTPVMQAFPAAALDLPLRVLVREDSPRRTVVAFHPIVALLAADGVPESVARRLQPAQQLLIDALHA